MTIHAPPDPMQVPVATRVEQFVKLRDKLRELEDRHKAERKPYDEAMEQLRLIILGHLDAAGVDSITAKGVGTAYRTVRKSATIADGDAFRRHVIGSQEFDLCDWRANANAVEAFINQHGAPPPGVNYSTLAQVGVRRG